MSNELKWVDSHIETTPPRKPKKLTGTRFATVLGLNPWASDFEIWCAVTRTYEKPFEDTIYTAAGKVIEPKQADYMKKSYMMDNLRTPTDVYGADYFRTTHGDFFPENQIFGGLWDYLLVDEKGKPQTVIECKTTKRSEDEPSPSLTRGVTAVVIVSAMACVLLGDAARVKPNGSPGCHSLPPTHATNAVFELAPGSQHTLLCPVYDAGKSHWRPGSGDSRMWSSASDFV